MVIMILLMHLLMLLLGIKNCWSLACLLKRLFVCLLLFWLFSSLFGRSTSFFYSVSLAFFSFIYNPELCFFSFLFVLKKNKDAKLDKVIVDVSVSPPQLIIVYFGFSCIDGSIDGSPVCVESSSLSNSSSFLVHFCRFLNRLHSGTSFKLMAWSCN